MKTPTIHRNGTAAGDLLQGYLEANAALIVATEIVAQCGPNARDYYTQEPGAFQVAVKEQEDRLERLRSVRREIEALAESVQQVQWTPGKGVPKLP